MGDWQFILAFWLIIQMVIGVARQPKLAELENKDGNHLTAMVAGTISKFIGMFTCLYFGGFYGPVM